MCIDFYSVHRSDIEKGNFPLNHDCILKVVYSRDCPLHFEYFTCQSQDSGKLLDILSKLALVKLVKISSVDQLPDIW